MNVNCVDIPIPKMIIKYFLNLNWVQKWFYYFDNYEIPFYFYLFMMLINYDVG